MFVRATDFNCRNMYTRLDLEKGYRSVFELLWYSQLPCFDVINVTTKTSEDYGKRFC